MIERDPQHGQVDEAPSAPMSTAALPEYRLREVSPELALVDPTLRRALRASLPDPIPAVPISSSREQPRARPPSAPPSDRFDRERLGRDPHSTARSRSRRPLGMLLALFACVVTMAAGSTIAPERTHEADARRVGTLAAFWSIRASDSLSSRPAASGSRTASVQPSAAVARTPPRVQSSRDRIPPRTRAKASPRTRSRPVAPTGRSSSIPRARATQAPIEGGGYVFGPNSHFRVGTGGRSLVEFSVSPASSGCRAPFVVPVIAVRSGSFRFVGRAQSRTGPAPEVRVTGRFVAADKAVGTMRITGTGDCGTGLVRFSAELS